MKRWFCAILCVATFAQSAIFADAIASFTRGKDFQDREDWYSAIESYQEALRANPAYQQVYQGLAECFYALGEFEQALTNVQKAETYRRNAPELQNLRAFTLIGLGRLDEASALFAQILKTWPNDVSARFGLAEIDVNAGRISAASAKYVDALRLNPQSRKALLSLALVSREQGNLVAAREYIQKALQYYGENPQVFYYAAHIALSDGKFGEAEQRIRNALSLRPDYDDARELLSALLYRTGRYAEVLDLCDERIATSRSLPSAWYMRALALEKQGRYDEAIKSARTGVQVAPEDEVMRAMAENVIIARLSFEDSRRTEWGAWHAARGAVFEQKNMSDQAMYEYRRALKINPYDVQSRQSYAKLLLARGYPERYVGQLEFIQSLGKSSATVNDAVESYKKMLANSISAKWKIDPLYLEKAHTKIGLYYQDEGDNVSHPDSARVTTMMLAEVIGYDVRFAVTAHERAVGSYSEAFRASREAGEDYFALVRFRENNRDMEIKAETYVSATGSRAETFPVFRTGNDRYANALRRLAHVIAAAMPVRGALLARYQADAVIDLGSSDGIAKGQSFNILEASAVRPQSEGLGLRYDQADVLGTFAIVSVGEDLSQGKLDRIGFFDRMNPGDTLVLIPPETKDKPAAANAGETSKTPPALLGLLRKIR